MSSHVERLEQLDTFTRQLVSAERVSAAWLSSMVEKTCRRLSLPSQKANFEWIHELVDDGAFIQAVIALVEFELPQWQIRRLTYDEGAWHCALSRQRELPDWLDQAVELAHPDMSLAIASVYLEILRQREGETHLYRSFVPTIHPGHFETLSCENFG